MLQKVVSLGVEYGNGDFKSYMYTLKVYKRTRWLSFHFCFTFLRCNNLPLPHFGKRILVRLPNCFENRCSSQQTILGIQWNFLRIIRFIADILVTFPLASDLFLKILPSRKITNNSGIYTYWGGNMSREGTARGKINNFSEAPRCIVFSKKRGHWCIHFLGKYWFFLEILLVVPYLK